MYGKLCKSEQKVYDLIVTTGLNKHEIAEILNISPHTVSTHIISILQKKDVDNQKKLIIQHYKNLLGEKNGTTKQI